MIPATPEQHVEVYRLFAEDGFTGELRLSGNARGRERIFVLPPADHARLPDVPRLEAAVARVLERRTTIVAASADHRRIEPF